MTIWWPGWEICPQRLGADQDIERIFFLGGGPLYGLVNQAMLKTKEMSLSHAEAYRPLEFRQDPMSMVNEHTDAKTLPVLIGEFGTKLGLQYLRIAAAGVLASLPPVVLAFIFQRFIIRGLTAGAVK